MKQMPNLSDAELARPKKQSKKVDPVSGPNGLSAKISRDQLISRKTVPVSLPKMSWEK